MPHCCNYRPQPNTNDGQMTYKRARALGVAVAHEQWRLVVAAEILAQGGQSSLNVYLTSGTVLLAYGLEIAFAKEITKRGEVDIDVGRIRQSVQKQAVNVKRFGGALEERR